jgi:hypothetical protein
MSITTLYVFDDGTRSIHVIGVDRPDVALTLMENHAEAHGLAGPEEDDETSLVFSYCRNIREEDGRLRYDTVNPLLVEDARPLLTWSGR